MVCAMNYAAVYSHYFWKLARNEEVVKIILGWPLNLLSYKDALTTLCEQRLSATLIFLEEDREYPALIHQKSAAHAGEDVAIYARGPMSHLFTGVHEQTFIAHGMAYASCIGWDKSHCKSNLSSSNRLQFSTLLLTVAMFYIMTTY